jgi:hypothetical protein
MHYSRRAYRHPLGMFGACPPSVWRACPAVAFLAKADLSLFILGELPCGACPAVAFF